MTKTRSIPYWTTKVFSSAVTDLVLIYESVTYDSLRTNDEWRMKTDLRLSSPELSYGCLNDFTNELSFITRGEPKRDHHLKQFICYYPFRPLLRNVCQSRNNALISTSVFVATKRAFNEPFSSNGLFRHNIYSLLFFSLQLDLKCINLYDHSPLLGLNSRREFLLLSPSTRSKLCDRLSTIKIYLRKSSIWDVYS
jgi:hypothetical protein